MSVRYSSGDAEQTFGDVQRRAWAVDTNEGFVIVIGVTRGPAGPRRKGGGIKSLGLLECGTDRRQSVSQCSVQTHLWLRASRPHCNSSRWGYCPTDGTREGKGFVRACS